MSRLSSSLISKKMALWLAFGATGLATGAVWATGFATVSATNGTPAQSPAILKTAPTPAASDLSGKAAPVTPITFEWDGLWGKVTAPKVMFQVDLSDFASTERYNIALLLDKTSTLTGWATLQLELEQVQIAANTTCDATDFDGDQNELLLNTDDQDAGVYWNNLPGDQVYCLGIAAGDGTDINGTFLRSASDTPPVGMPTFIATVDRTA